MMGCVFAEFAGVKSAIDCIGAHRLAPTTLILPGAVHERALLELRIAATVQRFAVM
jgi:hypothetical protein